MSILTNNIRNGNFTSSNAWRLASNGKVKGELSAEALKYIREKNLERRLGRSLELQKNTRATLWGHFGEMRVHDLLPLSYRSVGDVTVQHPEIDYWVGSPDNVNDSESVAGDTKCWEPKAFAEYIEVLQEADPEMFRKEYPKEYWQLISNSILLNTKHIEAIVYMPYKSELAEIREMAQNYDGPEPWKYRFIAEAPDCELPYLPDGGYYKNLNIFRFEALQADKDFLTAKIKQAGILLDPTVLIATPISENLTLIGKG